MRVWVFLFLSIFLFAFKGDNRTWPQGYFDWPVKHAVRVSGTFGELRPNHFHAGIDLKSRYGGSGDPLYAAAEGYVSRVKVQAAGYGNALYITHPNGFTTVYAHLQSFSEEIAAYIAAQQYTQESFEVDLYPEKDCFNFAQGAFIGRMGNTGSSQGAHLHFEIRETRSEKPVNPLLFGLQMEDRRPPRLHKLKVYGFDAQQREVEDQTFKLRSHSGQYRPASSDTLYTPFDRVGLAIKAFDHHDHVSNWNGIYGLEMRVDDSLAYSFNISSFSFAETRYVNALMDYREREVNRSYYYRCFRTAGNQLSFLTDNPAYGLVDLSDGQAHRIEIRTFDVLGNAAIAECWIKAGPGSVPEVDQPYQYILPFGESHLIQTDSFAVYFPPNTFYEDMYLDLSVTEDESHGHLSPVLHVHDHLVPVHRYFDVALRPDRPLTEEERRQAYVALCDHRGNVISLGGKWEENGLLHAKTREFGNFAILLDKRPPVVKNISVRSDMRGRRSMSLRIYDELYTDRHVEGLQYRATIDGEWVLMQYDRKSRRLTYTKDDRFGPGEHDFRLVVTDAVGNETVYERTVRF